MQYCFPYGSCSRGCRRSSLVTGIATQARTMKACLTKYIGNDAATITARRRRQEKAPQQPLPRISCSQARWSRSGEALTVNTLPPSRGTDFPTVLRISAPPILKSFPMSLARNSISTPVPMPISEFMARSSSAIPSPLSQWRMPRHMKKILLFKSRTLCRLQLGSETFFSGASRA